MFFPFYKAMRITRNDNQITIDCDSELETAQIYSLVVAVEIRSIETVYPLPSGTSAVLASLDTTATYLAESRKVVKSHAEAVSRYRDLSSGGLPDSKGLPPANTHPDQV